MSQTTKKIGYLSAMVFVVGTTIGAGIFFKNGELFSLGKGSLALVISTWIIAALGIMALGLSITELVSAQKSDRGIFEWTKKFVGKRFHWAAINYNKYIFAPVTLLTMPIYFTMTLEDAGMALSGGWAVGLVSFAVMLWFMLFNLFSIKISSILQWTVTILKFIPLIALPILAFAMPLDSGVEAGSKASEIAGINGISSAMVLIAGIPAITFAYDGFQSATALKESMNEPKKLGSATVAGLAIITGAYLLLTIAFGIGSTTGTIFGLKILDQNWAVTFFNVFIGIGILGIINGVTVGFSHQLAAHTKIDGEMEEANWIGKKIFKKQNKNDLTDRQRFLSAWYYILFSTIIFYVVFIPLGTWIYKINDYGTDYHDTSGTLYTLADFLVNFTSLLIILIMVTSVLGGVINRKTKKVQVEKQRFFLISSWFAIILFYGSGIWMVIAALIDSSGYNGAHGLSSLLKVAILVVIMLVSFVPTFLKNTNKEII